MAHNPLFAFFGTPDISTIVLDRLESHGFAPALVITAGDKPSGRGLRLSPSSAKEWALAREIEVTTPATLKDPAFLTLMQNTDWDVFIVSMYAKIIPKAILEIPRHGVLNVHPSLLPKFRGPSPVLSAILADERATGVTIMQLDERMDEGPILAQSRVELEEDAWPPKGSEFEKMLAHLGGDLLAEVLPMWIDEKITPEEQDSSKATYTKKFTNEDAYVDISKVLISEKSDRDLFLKIRAFDKAPRAYFLTQNGKRVIVTDAQWENNTLQITRVIPEGKREMDYADFLRGQRA